MNPALKGLAEGISGGHVKKKQGMVLTVIVLGIMGYVVYGSMARVEKQCEVCIEFGGGRRCARGAGATVEEARDGARIAVCGVLASGMDETIRCQNTPPKTETCS